MISKLPPALPFVVGLFVALACSSCVKQRTVTENGRVVSDNLVVERPIRDAIRESED
jgi:hypothetical protein